MVRMKYRNHLFVQERVPCYNHMEFGRICKFYSVSIHRVVFGNLNFLEGLYEALGNLEFPNYSCFDTSIHIKVLNHLELKVPWK